MKIVSFPGLLFLTLVTCNLISSSNLALAANTQETIKQIQLAQTDTQQKNQSIQSPSQQTAISLDENQLKSLNESLNKISQGLINSKSEEAWFDRLLSPLLGVILGSIGTFLITERNRKISKQERENDKSIAENKSKIELTYQIIKEWDTYREERNIADDIFVKNASSPMKAFSEHPPNERMYMNRILDFFDRINVLKEQNLINIELTRGYLSDDYTEWWNNYIKYQKGFSGCSAIETNPSYIKAFVNLPDEWLLII